MVTFSLPSPRNWDGNSYRTRFLLAVDAMACHGLREVSQDIKQRNKERKKERNKQTNLGVVKLCKFLYTIALPKCYSNKFLRNKKRVQPDCQSQATQPAWFRWDRDPISNPRGCVLFIFFLTVFASVLWNDLNMISNGGSMDSITKKHIYI